LHRHEWDRIAALQPDTKNKTFLSAATMVAAATVAASRPQGDIANQLARLAAFCYNAVARTQTTNPRARNLRTNRTESTGKRSRVGIVNHRLTGDIATFRESPNRGGAFREGLPDTLVIHFTAGRSLDSSVATLCNPASKASAHLVVGRDAKVVQLVDFNLVAWHAGVSRYRDRVGLNNFAIGIEIDNAGRLAKTAGGDFNTWFGMKIPATDVISAVHRNETQAAFWETFPAEQIDKVFELAQLLVAQYEIRTIVGHEEISPGRKTDPGPAFPLDRMRERLLDWGRDRDTAPPEDDNVLSGTVSASLLNVRAAPSKLSPIAASPLRFGTQIDVVKGDDHGEWIHIISPVSGWLKREFVTLSNPPDGGAPAPAVSMNPQ
jgi:N-acetylmuramoyl-L-alanine amidase